MLRALCPLEARASCCLHAKLTQCLCLSPLFTPRLGNKLARLGPYKQRLQEKDHSRTSFLQVALEQDLISIGWLSTLQCCCKSIEITHISTYTEMYPSILMSLKLTACHSLISNLLMVKERIRPLQCLTTNDISDLMKYSILHLSGFQLTIRGRLCMKPGMQTCVLLPYCHPHRPGTLMMLMHSCGPFLSFSGNIKLDNAGAGQVSQDSTCPVGQAMILQLTASFLCTS